MPREDKDSTIVIIDNRWMTMRNVGWKVIGHSKFEITVHDWETRSQLAIENAKKIEAEYEAANRQWDLDHKTIEGYEARMAHIKASPRHADMPSAKVVIPYNVRKTITLTKVGAKALIEAYDKKYEVTLLRQ